MLFYWVCLYVKGFSNQQVNKTGHTVSTSMSNSRHSDFSFVTLISKIYWKYQKMARSKKEGLVPLRGRQNYFNQKQQVKLSSSYKISFNILFWNSKTWHNTSSKYSGELIRGIYIGTLNVFLMSSYKMLRQ